MPNQTVEHTRNSAPPVFANTRTHVLPDGSLEVLGAVSGVTGAMTRVDLSGTKLLVDCGQPQGTEARAYRFPARAREVDAVVLTHGHVDHVAALPELLGASAAKPGQKRDFEGAIYGTPATLRIAEIVLRDGLRLKDASDDDSRQYITRFLERVRPVPYNTPTLIGEQGVSIELHEAGHILGSSSVEIRSEQARVICSGDLGRPGTPLLQNYETQWRDDRPVDLVLMESTYGDREHGTPPAQVRDQLLTLIRRALQDGGHILMPAFAIGRTQALLYHLNALVESGQLRELPVAVDTPMGLLVTETYRHFRHLFDEEALRLLSTGDNPLDFEQLYAVRRQTDSVRLDQVQQPMLIIAGSGMCTGGRVLQHLVELLPRPETMVIFPGFQARGTLGREIVQAARSRRRKAVAEVAIGAQSVPLRAQVEILSGLSAHADRTELTAWLRAIPGVQRVALHHGERRVQERFAERLRAG